MNFYRRFLLFAGLAGMLAVLSTRQICSGASQTNISGENVLFIAVDDLKPTLGCYGDVKAITPNIDRLADNGVVFLNAHCQWSVCGPSRASVTTSLMPEETGVTGFKALRYRLPDLITLPQHFKNNGYETAAIGKIHDNRTVGNLDPDNPSGKTLNGSQIDDVLSWSIPYNNGGGGIAPTTATSADIEGKTLKLIAESIDAADSAFIDGSICNKGIAQLNSLTAQYKSTGKPFFLGVGFKKPHMPFMAPKKYWDYYKRDDFTIHPFQQDPLNVLTNTFNAVQEMRGNYFLELDVQGKAITIPQIIPEHQQKELLHGYYACALFIDAQVGRLLDELQMLGIADDTIIVFWGDHGFHLGDHNEWGKHTNMEQATRSPLIISAPNVGVKGRKTMTPVTFLDIYPTLCELAGLEIPEQPLSDTQPTGRPLRGKSLVPVLQNPNDSVRFGAYSHYGSDTYGYSYRTERYRYVEWIKGSGVIDGYELYDYKFDPYETVNIAPDTGYDILVRQLSRSMRADGECSGCERLKTTNALTVDPDTIALSFAQEDFNTYNLLHNTGKDTSDAQFSLLVDFDSFDDSVSSMTQTVFDIGGGGGGDGFSLVYGPGNELIITICGDNSTRVDATYTLSLEQIAAGMLEVTAVVDIDHAGGDGTEDLILLFIERKPFASAVTNLIDNDFVNSDKSGFGMTGGNATGGWQSTEDSVGFTSGTINYAAGLWYSNNITGIEVGWCAASNLDGNYPVDMSDLALLVYNWLGDGVGLEGDIKKDGSVDVMDFSVLSSCWLSDSD